MRVEVDEGDGFKRLLASEPIRAGEAVLRLSSVFVHGTPTRTSIRVGPGQHVEDPIGACINHSCDPSCAIDGFWVIALNDLSEGDEITFDYTDNEGPLASPFTCSKCGKLLVGAPAPCRD